MFSESVAEVSIILHYSFDAKRGEEFCSACLCILGALPAHVARAMYLPEVAAHSEFVFMPGRPCATT